ncbi:unnamed protein product [Spirodela intermedia]|uniref:At3g05675-like ankyrin-like domain-containing protein n=1 Tax=Spirodela intermedia TaxID=51605 RepID=A0A7I8IB80_SPIIN|nr:unnamed protein product [Spirodela intermedia]CAA6654840.1 unnamed protein product [Spirodela intermedia]
MAAAAAAAAAAADHILKSGDVSTMIRQGFLSSPMSPARISPAASPPPPRATLFFFFSPAAAAATDDNDDDDDHHHHHHPLRYDRRGGALPAPANSGDQGPSGPLRQPEEDPAAGEGRRHPRRGKYPDGGAGDVELTVSSGDGFRVSLTVHRSKLAGAPAGAAHAVEICDCDDAVVYVEAVALMYCHQPRQKLAGETISKVLALLKLLPAGVGGDTLRRGVAACLEHLESAPWTEDEEEKVVAALRQLRLPQPASEVLVRVSVDPGWVLQAKDDKARREMKNLISGLLQEDDHHPHRRSSAEVSKETFYQLCHQCLNSLLVCLSEAADAEDGGRDRGTLMAEISREADNHAVDRRPPRPQERGEEFVWLWADQMELAKLHSKIPSMYRFEISRVTAQLCVAVGRGQILVSREAKSSLLRTWLEALYEDFGWMRRASRTFDKKLVEEGLCQTILTLPMPQQQAILLDWFDRFLNKGDDCPDIQKAFQIWWRRAFVRQYVGAEDNSQLQVALCMYPT